MASDNSAVVTVGSSEGGIEPGQTRTGTVTGTDVYTKMTDEGTEILLYRVDIREDEYGVEFDPRYSMGEANNPTITDNGLLGQVVSRFGVGMEEGEQVNLDDLFTPGTKLDFEIIENNWTDQETGETREGFDIDRESIRPAGGDAPEDATATATTIDDGGPDVDDALRAGVLEIVEEHEGSTERDVKKAIASSDRSSEMWAAYKQLRNGGDVETMENNDGETLVFLA